MHICNWGVGGGQTWGVPMLQHIDNFLGKFLKDSLNSWKSLLSGFLKTTNELHKFPSLWTPNSVLSCWHGLIVGLHLWFMTALRLGTVAIPKYASLLE